MSAKTYEEYRKESPRKMTWSIVVVLCMIISCLYIFSYFRYQTNISILQTRLNDFHFDMLREKQPLVVEDQIVHLEDIAKNWFSPNIVIPFVASPSDVWYMNRGKYMIMCAEDEGDIYIYPAGKAMEDGAPPATENLVAIHLKPQQTLVLPLHWHYLSEIKCNAMEVHDYVTYFLRRIV